ncbi:hypothetical protein SADUNF_Sadunf18G0111800 [Salix dunnii]|uniref:Glycoside hydrolase family 3 C-terminal domain-containing protein n=1 Tax=Salix dunnii TaxID=1413687 RepID=A0A835ME96_9ROSI|nr:hypothetical protein SADUNF_Sadunf18G0111800 [Salix dunnii]
MSCPLPVKISKTTLRGRDPNSTPCACRTWLASSGSDTTAKFFEPSLSRKTGPYVCDIEARRRWFRSLPTWSQLPNIGYETGPGGRLLVEDLVKMELNKWTISGSRGRMTGMGIGEKYVDKLGHASFMHETNATARRVKHTDFATNEAMFRRRDGWKWIEFGLRSYFDGNPQHNSLGKDDIRTDENIELATEAAREATVLLKNENGALPLSYDKIKTLAVAGPSANATDAMIGSYAEYAEVDYQMGCHDVACKNETFIFPAMQAAEKADATVIIVGMDLSIEDEGRDRADLLLPGCFIVLAASIFQEAVHVKLGRRQCCRDLGYKYDSYKPHCPAIRVDDIVCNYQFEVEVQNVGSIDGSEVVIIYSKPAKGIAATYLEQVIGFKRVFVPAGGVEKVNVVDYNAYRVLPSGAHTIMLGDDMISFPLESKD